MRARNYTAIENDTKAVVLHAKNLNKVAAGIGETISPTSVFSCSGHDTTDGIIARVKTYMDPILAGVEWRRELKYARPYLQALQNTKAGKLDRVTLRQVLAPNRSKPRSRSSLSHRHPAGLSGSGRKLSRSRLATHRSRAYTDSSRW